MSLTSDHWWCVDIIGGPHDGLHLHLAHLHDTIRLPRPADPSVIAQRLQALTNPDTVADALFAMLTDDTPIDVYRHHQRADGHHVYLHPHIRTYPEGDA